MPRVSRPPGADAPAAVRLGWELRCRREQMPLTREQVAEALRYSVERVKQVENGTRNPAGAGYMNRWGEVYGLDEKLRELWQQVLDQRREEPEPTRERTSSDLVQWDQDLGSGDEEADTKRRVVLRGLAAAGLAVAGCPVAEPGGWPMPRRIGPDHVADVVDTTQVYRQWVSRHGGVVVRRPVGLLLERASAMVARSRTSAVRRDLLVAIGDVANLGAYVARDLGHAAEAQHYYQVSLSAAHAGDHVGLGAHAIVRMAGHYIELRQPDQVLIHLQAARSRASDHLAAGDLANQWCIEAWAHAQTGNIQATQRAIGLAEEAFTHITGDDCPRAPWAAQHVTEAELYSLTGAALVDLAHHRPSFAESATERLHRALALRNPSAARNRILDRVSLAEAYLKAGELDQAVQAAVLALDGIEEINSVRLQNRLRTLKRSLALHARTHPLLVDFIQHA